MASELNEHELAAFQSGDEKVFRKIFSLFWRRIYLLFINANIQPQDAEERTQDTFRKLWQHRARLNDNRHIINFLFLTARNSLADHYKKAKHDIMKQFSELSEEELSQLEKGASLAQIAPELVLIHRLWAARALEIIKDLPDQRREIFIRHLEGKKTKDIANSMKISASNVSTQIGIARKYITEQLLKEGFSRDLLLCFIFFLIIFLTNAKSY